ncbi:MAG: hypothetical protein B7X58_16055, partial [Marinobacter sp. 34-60-7]
MPSSYSTSLRVELIGNGEQTGNWGTTTNRNLGTLLEQGITGVETLDISAGSFTLAALNGAADQARNAMLVLEGIPAGPVTLTVPNVQKLYRVRNNTAVKVTFATALGTGYECPANSLNLIECDGVGTGTVTGTSITDAMAAVLKADTLAASITAMGAAPINSPVFTGTPTAPTPAQGTNNTQLATTAFVFQNSVPTGGIIMWSGAANAIPTGWRLCDGTNSTPNLTDRFVIGAGNSYAVGATGGSKDAVVVSHAHTGTTGGHSNDHAHSGSTSTAGQHAHSGVSRWASNFSVGGDGNGWMESGNYNKSTDAAGDHAHSFTT